MSSAWPPAGPAAERVPAWTRPVPARFTARPAGSPPGGFAAWAAPDEGDPAPTMVLADPTADALVADALARGFDAGHAAASEAWAVERAADDRLAEALARLGPEPPDDLAALLAEAVGRLVRQVMGEVAIDAGRLAARAHAVAALIAEESAPHRLRLHPADLARLEGVAPEGLTLVADPALPEGTIRAETATGWVEDGPAIRLERLRALTDQLARGR